MKVLILGSKGMLGQELVRAFFEYEQICLSKNDVDITNYLKTTEKINDIKPDLIINATAYNNVDEAEKSEEWEKMALKINGYAVENLAKIAQSINAKFIHFSTDYVFDGTEKDGYQEDAIPNPINKYGKSKLLGEELTKKNIKKYYIIRLTRLFGKPALSENGKKSFVDLMLNLAKTKRELKVVNDAFGNLTYAPDIAKATLSLVEKKYPYGIYHITNEGSCTFYELAKKIFEIKGIDIKVIPVTSDEFPRLAKIPIYSSLINQKFPKLRRWEDALKEYLNTN
ncbi:MAG: dTDP-4-dehydrorhamnose reductase [Patescibacteria group bacterium]